MLADTYTLNGIAFTKRDGDLVRGSSYTDGATPVSQRTWMVKYQTDRKGTTRTLVDFSTNVPDEVYLTKVDHVRRSYLNIVAHPSDAAEDIQSELDCIAAVIANGTLLNLILKRTA